MHFIMNLTLLDNNFVQFKLRSLLLDKIINLAPLDNSLASQNKLSMPNILYY